MKTEDIVKDIANDNNAIVTVQDTLALGLKPSTLRQYARRHPETLLQHARGIYEYLDPHDELLIDWSEAHFALALKFAGPESYLVGSSVLGFYHLAYANPDHVYVRAPKAPQRTLPHWLRVTVSKKRERLDIIRGIRMQNVASALLEARHIRPDYRYYAVDDAEERNLISPADAIRVKKILEKVVKK